MTIPIPPNKSKNKEFAFPSATERCCPNLAMGLPNKACNTPITGTRAKVITDNLKLKTKHMVTDTIKFINPAISQVIKILILSTNVLRSLLILEIISPTLLSSSHFIFAFKICS